MHPSFLLPPANEVWDKVIFSQSSVCPRGGDVADTLWADTPWKDTPPEAGGTHPTGMRSCSSCDQHMGRQQVNVSLFSMDL